VNNDVKINVEHCDEDYSSPGSPDEHNHKHKINKNMLHEHSKAGKKHVKKKASSSSIASEKLDREISRDEKE
jgi:hypothetical protein